MTGPGAGGAAPGRLNAYRRVVVGVLVCLGLALAFSHRFVQDDAYILYRYADHLARGLGLVWNPGEPVEGYSCFSFTVTLGAGAWLGLDPVPLAMGLGLLGFAATLLASYALGRRLFGHWGWGASLAFLVATHPVATAWATGGMATSWETALVAGGLLQLHRVAERAAPRGGDYALLSLLALLAILTRPEGLMVASVLLSVGAGLALRPAGGTEARAGTARAARLGWLLGPALAGLGIYALWKLRTYGDLVPTSVRAKAGGGSYYLQGVAFLFAFFVSTGLGVAAAMAACWGAIRGLRAWRGRRGAGATRLASREPAGRAGDPALRPWLWLLGAFVALWLVLAARVGGDFMEFRALAPVLPLGFALWLGFVRGAARRPSARLALLLLVPAGGLHHRLTFQEASYRGRVETIADLRDHVEAPGRGWVAVGKGLRAEVGDLPGLFIATTAAGAIPYLTGLPTVDMLGLNDPEVARGPAWREQSIGHRRAASMAYLLERGVVLLLGHPRVVPRAARRARGSAAFGAGDRQALLGRVPDPERVPGGARLVAIPISAGHALVVAQLRPHPGFDARVRARGWPAEPFFPGLERAPPGAGGRP